MNHETPAGTRLMERVCVCVVALIVSSSVLGRKRVCDIENTHTHTLLCVWYVVRKLHVH